MVLTLLAFLTLAAWCWLALFHGGFWRASERLEPSPAPASWPEIAILVPARNEAETIARVVASHIASDYPGAFSLTVIDDASDDGTGDLARRAGADAAGRVDVIAAPPLPAGWTGKLSALAGGVDHVEHARPDARYFLFTDADIEHAPGTLRALVAKAESENLALASLMARLDSRGLFGALLIPAFVYFFQKLYPFPRANDPSARLAAGAGGCMLINRAALAEAGGVASIRDRLIDDCALADRLKNHGAGAPRATWIGLADMDVVSLRDNRSLSSIWNMVARTAFAQLDHNWAALAGTIMGMAVVYLAPPAIALAYPVHGNTAAGVAALAAWIAMATTFLPTARLYGLAAPLTFALPVSAALYTAMTVSSGLRHARGAGGRWKGRTYA